MSLEVNIAELRPELRRREVRGGKIVGPLLGYRMCLGRFDNWFNI